MNIIIDTHIFLWLLYDPHKISQKHLKYLEEGNNRLYLSAMSIAEMMIKKSMNNLEINFNMDEVLKKMDIEVLDFDTKSALLLGSLPFHHKDPFDRMIISQALANKYKVISLDRKFSFYACDLI